ncbi:MAG: hypothetical protein RBR42_01095 [Desulfomicrobium sp.]|nr:hypothetical protein [Desulfomicrobium sp.]
MIFPYYDISTSLIFDGKLYHCSSVCLKNNEKCKNYYNRIANTQGFHECPHGFTSYVRDNSQIITALKVNGYFSKKKTKTRNTSYSPTITEDAFLQYIQSASRENTINMEKEIGSLFHEIGRLNADILYKSNELILGLTNTNFNLHSTEILENVSNIFACSQLISIRNTFYNFERNPSATIKEKVGIEIYKKFDKVKKSLLRQARKNNINMWINGECTDRIDGYDIFDMLPFLIIDNAIKYAPKDTEINIEFSELMNNRLVTIESYGPLLEDGEKNYITIREFRGKRARKVAGSGIGLYFAKKICELNSIRMEISSDKTRIKTFDGEEMAPFKVELLFPHAY